MTALQGEEEECKGESLLQPKHGPFSSMDHFPMRFPRVFLPLTSLRSGDVLQLLLELLVAQEHAAELWQLTCDPLQHLERTEVGLAPGHAPLPPAGSPY